MTLEEVLPPLHARLGSMLSAVLLTSVVAVTFESVLLAGVDDVTLESVLLSVVDTTVLTVLFGVLVTAVGGVHAASARMLIVITRQKMFFWFISLLHLYTVPHNSVNLKFRIWLTKQFKILLINVNSGKYIEWSIAARCFEYVKEI